jgi:hypothetical protein
MWYDKLLLGGRRWMQWTIDGKAPRSYPATKTHSKLRRCVSESALGPPIKAQASQTSAVFAHGQLYVGFPRATSSEHIKVILSDEKQGKTIRNTVQHITKFCLTDCVLQYSYCMNKTLNDLCSAMLLLNIAL